MAGYGTYVCVRFGVWFGVKNAIGGEGKRTLYGKGELFTDDEA